MELNGQHIIFLGATRFDRTDQSTSFTIAKLLARHNIVLYVDYPITWKDYFVNFRKPLIKTRLPYFKSTSDGIMDTSIKNFKVIIVPPIMSINFLPEGWLYRKLLKLNESRISKQIKRVLLSQGISDYIYINSFNFHYPNISEKLAPKLTIYHCVDPMIMPYDIKHGVISEDELVEKSEMVICTSKELYSQKKILNPITHFVPNAADVNHSSKALAEDVPVHHNISDLRRPLIGYVGSIERRMDFDLLKYVIENNPDKTFAFAGEVSEKYAPEWLTQMPNVFLAGRLPYDDIPSFIKGFDIAIIPFKKDDVSSTIFPLKLFEYLGAGKPVISTNFNPDIKEFTSDTVAFCDSAGSFNESLNYELKNDSAHKRKLRISVAERNTWEKRADQIEELIFLKLREKGDVIP